MKLDHRRQTSGNRKLKPNSFVGFKKKSNFADQFTN